MEITVVPLSRRPPPVVGRSRSSSESARSSEFITLMKPRVMLLAVFTAFVGLMIAPSPLDPLAGSIAILAIAAGAGAAGVLNMWYEADIDRLMSRTARRPIPRGTVSPVEALVFGLTLAGAATAALALAVNIEAAGLLASAIFFYVFVYTIWLKRRTPQNIVIGGAAGALPPVIGWAAATANVGFEPLVLFLIIFLWTPPHFWALAIRYRDDYAAADVPMLPVVASFARTGRQIMGYTLALWAASLVFASVAGMGWLYWGAAILLGAVFVAYAARLFRDGTPARAMALFGWSITYVTLLFGAMAADTLLRAAVSR